MENRILSFKQLEQLDRQWYNDQSLQTVYLRERMVLRFNCFIMSTY